MLMSGAIIEESEGENMSFAEKNGGQFTPGRNQIELAERDHNPLNDLDEQ